LLVGLFGVVFVFVQSCQRPATGLDAYAKDSLKKLTVREAPFPAPVTRFTTVDGQALTLEQLHGKVVLVNIWFTACPPCIKEMPSLDRLQTLRGGDDFQVVTISVDRTNDLPSKFFEDNDIENLAPWHDGTYGITGNLNIRGFPTTVIYDARGDETAFLEGDAEWDSPEALTLVDYLIAR